MSDREKVINEQQKEIEELEERLMIALDGQPEIVRCKNCTWYKNYYCTNWNSPVGREPDWFCADGEKADT